jgi:AcrR family transcriptional regulator
MGTDLSLRERKKIETRNRILDVAIQLFQERGLEQTSVDEIAAQANISRGTFFNYFGGKESILHEIALNERRLLQQLIEVDLAEQPSAVVKIRRVMHRLVVDTLPYLHITRYVLIGAILYPSDETAISLHLGELLSELVREAQGQDEIRADLPPGQVTHAILGAYLSLLFEQIAHTVPGQPQDTATVPASMERIVDMIFSGIAGPEYKG